MVTSQCYGYILLKTTPTIYGGNVHECNPFERALYQNSSLYYSMYVFYVRIFLINTNTLSTKTFPTLWLSVRI